MLRPPFFAHRFRTARRRVGSLVALAVAIASLTGASSALGAASLFNLNQLERVERAAGYGSHNKVTLIPITYRAFDGQMRRAYVILPRDYRPGHDPPIPLVISPHGRGVAALSNAKLWGNLPAIGDFAVVCPEGQGRRLTLFAWGYRGDVADLARMPGIVERALPYLRIDPHRIYAVGGSMGGQEALLLIAREPHLLAGAAVFDADTDLSERYSALASTPHGLGIRQKLVEEVGGTPAQVPAAYRARSPIDHVRQIAFSGVPLQLWWSTKDRIVRDQARQSGLLYRRILALDPHAHVIQIVGTWAHSAEFKATRRLALALSILGLMPVRQGVTMTAAEKRALELPATWPATPLSIVAQGVEQCTTAGNLRCRGSS